MEVSAAQDALPPHNAPLPPPPGQDALLSMPETPEDLLPVPECPVCNTPLPGFSELEVGRHIDDCLTMGMLTDEKSNRDARESMGRPSMPIINEPTFACPYSRSCGRMTAMEFASHVIRTHANGPHHVFCPICEMLGEHIEVNTRKLNLWAHLNNDHADLMAAGASMGTNYPVHHMLKSKPIPPPPQPRFSEDDGDDDHYFDSEEEEEEENEEEEEDDADDFFGSFNSSRANSNNAKAAAFALRPPPPPLSSNPFAPQPTFVPPPPPPPPPLHNPFSSSSNPFSSSSNPFTVTSNPLSNLWNTLATAANQQQSSFFSSSTPPQVTFVDAMQQSPPVTTSSSARTPIAFPCSNSPIHSAPPPPPLHQRNPTNNAAAPFFNKHVHPHRPAPSPAQPIARPHTTTTTTTTVAARSSPSARSPLARSPGLSSSYNVSVLKGSLPESECFICFELFTEGQEISRVECMCVFHTKCLDKWYQKKRCCPFHLPSV